MIDTGAIVRRKLVRAEDIRSIPETIKLKSVTRESTPIMNEAGIDLISSHGLIVDPVEKVLRLCTEKCMRNCTETKPVRL